MKQMLSNKRAILIFMLPASLFFLCVQILPIFMTGYYSLLDWNGMSDGIFIGFQNYTDLFTMRSLGFSAALINSFKYAFFAVFLQLPIALFLALMLTSGVKAERFFVSVFFIPVLISTSVTGQLFVRIYNSDYGILNRLLTAVGLQTWTRSWLADPNLALYCVFVPMVWQFVGYHMLLMYASIRTISTEIMEAATIDGAGFWRRSFKITIPLIRPTLRICLIFALTGALKMFDLVNVMTDGGPMRASEVPATLMVRQIFTQYHFGRGSAIAVWIIAECFLASLLVRKFMKVEEL